MVLNYNKYRSGTCSGDGGGGGGDRRMPKISFEQNTHK